MTDWSIKLKTKLEQSFSMPFEVSLSVIDGEKHYICWPSNDGDTFFSVQVYLHNHIRLLVEIEPQKYGRSILYELANAIEDKKNCFFEYLKMLREIGGRIKFKVNDVDISTENWPSDWRSFSCKITKIPVEVNDTDEEFEILSEWMIHGINLIFTLLTIETNENPNEFSTYTEGDKYQVLSTRYERNPINRQLCLYKKGYTCVVCGTNLYEKYGEIGRKYIQVHHTTPVSMMGDNYRINIDKDLVPLCPNCHAMIHRKTPPYSVDELMSFWEEQNTGGGLIAAEQPQEYNLINNVIVGVVKKENVSNFIDGKANLYYFGKRFPPKYNLKNIQYFAPYFDGGIRGYYNVKSVRTARKSEILNLSESNDEDTRIILDLGSYHPLTEKPIKLKLASYNYAFMPLDELITKV